MVYIGKKCKPGLQQLYVNAMSTDNHHLYDLTEAGFTTLQQWIAAAVSPNACNALHETLLVQSIIYNREECFYYLLEQGAELSKPLPYWYSPIALLTAARQLRISMFEQLLINGADPNVLFWDDDDIQKATPCTVLDELETDIHLYRHHTDNATIAEVKTMEEMVLLLKKHRAKHLTDLEEYKIWQRDH